MGTNQNPWSMKESIAKIVITGKADSRQEKPPKIWKNRWGSTLDKDQ